MHAGQPNRQCPILVNRTLARKAPSCDGNRSSWRQAPHRADHPRSPTHHAPVSRHSPDPPVFRYRAGSADSTTMRYPDIARRHSDRHESRGLPCHDPARPSIASAIVPMPSRGIVNPASSPITAPGTASVAESFNAISFSYPDFILTYPPTGSGIRRAAVMGHTLRESACCSTVASLSPCGSGSGLRESACCPTTAASNRSGNGSYR